MKDIDPRELKFGQVVWVDGRERTIKYIGAFNREYDSDINYVVLFVESDKTRVILPRDSNRVSLVEPATVLPTFFKSGITISDLKVRIEDLHVGKKIWINGVEVVIRGITICADPGIIKIKADDIYPFEYSFFEIQHLITLEKVEPFYF